MANRRTRALASAVGVALLLQPLIGGSPAQARPLAPPTSCTGPAPCAAPWMAYLTNLALGRAPQDADYGAHAPADDLTRAQRAAIARQQITSLAGRRFTVELHYFRVLGRAPDPSGADFWPRAMVDGRRNTELLDGSLLGSNEFARRWPDWITQMYDVVLARQPDPGGYAYWTAQAARQSNERVARRFLSSAAARRERARLVFAALFAAPALPAPSATEVDDAARLLGTFTGEDDLIVQVVSRDDVYGACQAA